MYFGRSRDRSSLASGIALLRTPYEPQHQIAEQPEHDQKAEQHQRVHPKWRRAALLGQDGLHRDVRSSALRADGVL